MSLTTSAECVPELLSADRFHGSVGGVLQATKELGNGKESSCHLNEMGGRERQATRVPVEIVRKRIQTLGSDDAKNVCINGTARVRDVLTLQSLDVQTQASCRKILFLDASRAHYQAEATGD